MNEKISILIPQRGRPAQTKKCVELILKNTSYPDYEVILICDEDDLSSVSLVPKDERVKIITIPYKPLPPQKMNPVIDGNLLFKATENMRSYLATDIKVWDGNTVKVSPARAKQLIKAYPENFSPLNYTEDIPQRPMYVKKINYAYKNIAKGDYIVYLANDVEVDKNWLTEAVKTLKEKSPDDVGGLVSFNDGVYEGKFAPHGLISRKFVEKFLGGYVLHPAYVHYYADSDLGTIAKRFKRYYYADKSIIYHKWANDGIRAPMRRIAARMKEVHNLRKKRGFPTVKEEMKHDICFQVWNRPEWTERSLESLDRYTDWGLVNKFYIMDDNSEEKTRKILERYENPKKIYIRENFGSSRASFLKFITLAKTILVFNFENDVLAPENWNRILAEDFIKDPYIAVIRGWSQDLPPDKNYTTCLAGYRLEFIKMAFGATKTIENRWPSDHWKGYLNVNNKLVCNRNVFFDKLEFHEEELPLLHQYYLKGWERRDIDDKYRLNIIRKIKEQKLKIAKLQTDENK